MPLLAIGGATREPKPRALAFDQAIEDRDTDTHSLGARFAIALILDRRWRREPRYLDGDVTLIGKCAAVELVFGGAIGHRRTFRRLASACRHASQKLGFRHGAAPQMSHVAGDRISTYGMPHMGH